jgi:segregation and condensation protein B
VTDSVEDEVIEQPGFVPEGEPSLAGDDELSEAVLESDLEDEAEPENEIEDEVGPETEPEDPADSDLFVDGSAGFDTCKRIVEAVLFASAEPVSEDALRQRLPLEVDLEGVLAALVEDYGERGVNLVRLNNRWAFRTAADLATHLRIEQTVQRRLSRAAVETLAIIAYHQPVTRAEIEEIRGVALSKGTLDILLEAGWIRPRGRRRVPGRPLTWGTSPSFLDQFGLSDLGDLPGVEELRSSGILDRSGGRGAIAMRQEDLIDEDEDDEDTDDDQLPLLEEDYDEDESGPEDPEDISEIRLED